ncbi:MAG: capsular polysaccharide biosynthesis protein [Rhodobacteraceae bacterium]|nr:MAG: capsular polysaccharide biosynthesis protein [Paracoccaceae bacterium]
MDATGPSAAGGTARRRLCVYNGGFLRDRRLRRILSLAGYDIRLGRPGPQDLVGIWGDSPTAHRGRRAAARHGVGLLRVEDAFLRSLHPGRRGDPPLGLSLDLRGVHFDAGQPSDLETLLASHALDDTALLDRARAVIARLAAAHLTKYSAVDPALPLPDPGYVVVIDQTREDASVRASRADRARFVEMLAFAQEEHPGARVLIKTHPETAQGFRPGHFGPEDTNDRIQLLSDPVSPWALFEGAVGVYTVSSQLGFEAILAGHRPRVFGQPFYAGWGLTVDDAPVARRERRLTRAQLVAAALILYPTWYDPFADALCEVERVLDILEAQARAWRQDRHGWVAGGMRLWKRPALNRVFGGERRILFEDDAARARATGRPRMVWAGKAGPGDEDAALVEDGFLRSRGLGAGLVPPLSLVVDDLGIYYDPARPSRLERLIALRETLRPDQALRAERLIASVTGLGVTKYNLGGARPDLPKGRRILVPGQVEDDASILRGTGAVRTNFSLLQATREANPDCVLLYKPHPDVEAGLRAGEIRAEGLADVVLADVDTGWLLGQVDEVWTMTSGLGFEALLRGLRVTTLGVPFYAGWGLTTDLAPPLARRSARPTLAGLVHATLIDYPRYHDPVTNRPCPVEVAVARLASGAVPRPGPLLRALSKVQGALATHAHLWR